MENNSVKVGIVIMASGLSKRFGGNKLMASLCGKELIRWIIDATYGVFDERVVVTRSREVVELCEKIGIKCIYHEFPGRNDTVRIGLGELLEDADVCFFTPGDQPLIKRDTLIRLVENAKNNPSMITRAGFMGTPGSPVGFPRRVYDELLDLPYGKGGGYVAAKYPELIQLVPVEAEYELMDVDTADALEQIKKYL